MYNMANLILNTVMVIASIWIVNRFWSGFFEQKKNKIVTFLFYAIYALYQFYIQYNKGSINVYITAINVLLILMVGIFAYKSVGKKKYFLLLIFYAMWSLIEVFVYILIKNIPIEKVQLNIMGVVISNILMIIFVYILPIVWNKKENDLIPFKYYFFLLLIPVGSIYVAISEFYSKENSIFSLLTISIMLLFNVIIFEIYSKLSKIFVYENEKTVYVQQLDMISKNTKAQKKMMEDFHQEKHNLINELIALKNGVENSDNETVIRNLNRIIKNCNSVETISISGNSTVDSLINFKYADAKEYDIEFCVKILIPDELPIEQCDLGVALGNAIDNAIEATKKCENNKKLIDISMGVKKEALIIVIKNPYEHSLKVDRNKNYLSTKAKKFQHGYGLNSIKKVVEEYQGIVITTTDHNIFSLTMVMNFREL